MRRRFVEAEKTEMIKIGRSLSRRIPFFVLGVAVLGASGGKLLGALAPPEQLFVLELTRRAETPSSSRLALESRFTLEAWVYFEDGSAYGRLILGKEQGGERSYGLGTDASNGFPLLAQSTGQPGSTRQAIATSPLPLRTWTHLAGTLDGSTLRLYVNGLLAASTPSPGPPALDASPFTIGGTNGFGGKVAIRLARVWGVARTAGEITDTAGRPVTGNETGLLAAWPLDDGLGGKARDASPGHLDLTFGGGGSGDPRWIHPATVESGPYFAIEGPFPLPATGGTTKDRVTFQHLIDFDSDGHLDMIVAPASYDGFPRMPLIAMKNAGNGRFSDVSATLFRGARPWSQIGGNAVVADFNGDGRMDLFLGDMGPDHTRGPGGQNHLLLQTADGHMEDVTLTNLPLRNRGFAAVCAADFAGNGVLDLFAGVWGGALAGPLDLGRPLTYRNDGKGVFRIDSSRYPAAMADLFFGLNCVVGDFDGDGHVDLIAELYPIMGPPGAPATLLLNDGQGNLRIAPANSLPPRQTGRFGQRTTVADFNGDGSPDVVTLEWSVPGSPRIVLWLNNGNGTFRDASARIPQDGAGGPSTLIVEDFNGDGRPDLFTAGGGGGDPTRLYLNTGDANFVDATELLPIDRPGSSEEPVAGNLAGTGRADVLAVNSSMGNWDYRFVRNPALSRS